MKKFFLIAALPQFQAIMGKHEKPLPPLCGRCQQRHFGNCSG